ncbi:MAG TPA: ketopantoate reductase [Sulfurospirillum sp. UBA12182]|nr:MAG TPA: ketopantoate reductase [Sulfurospirillum sp. UBA12182]
MKICIFGAGGVGAYYGARLLSVGAKVTFVARGEHLRAMQKNGLHVKHPSFEFFQNVDACDMQELGKKDVREFDAVIILVKAMYTSEVGLFLKQWCKDSYPYIISLQNGVENEEELSLHVNPKKLIGGLSVKIGAHIVAPGVVEAVGESRTILGAWEENEEAKEFLDSFKKLLETAEFPVLISEDIRLELWKKLIINNGVNAICALLERKTGEVVHDKKLSQIVLGLMRETANAARGVGVHVSTEDVEAMFDVIKGFDSIKPSMLVDRENGRVMELEEICGVVIRNCQKQGLDAPYTKTISYLLEFLTNSNPSSSG